MGVLRLPPGSRSTAACWGQCVTGSDLRLVTAVHVMLISGTAAYYAFVLWYVWLEISIVLAVLAGAVPLLSYVSLVVCSRMDPGILPRGDFPPPSRSAADARRRGDAERHDDPDQAHPQPRETTPILYEEVRVSGHPTARHFCTTCHILRPLRASHCRVCNNCVEVFDHHCVWIGNCVGKRNYRPFVLFVWTTLLFLASGLAMGALQITFILVFDVDSANSSFWGTVGESFSHPVPFNTIAPLVLIAVGVSFFFPLLGLAVYNVQAMCLNVTTYEEIRGDFDGYPNPFARSYVRNFGYALCPPYYPSLLENP